MGLILTWQRHCLVEAKLVGLSEGVWAFVLIDGAQFDGTEPRRLIRFERNVCYVVEPGKKIFEVKPKKLERTDAVTLIAETGFWHYGRVSMRFDSATDADIVEQKLRPLLPDPPK